MQDFMRSFGSMEEFMQAIPLAMAGAGGAGKLQLIILDDTIPNFLKK